MARYCSSRPASGGRGMEENISLRAMMPGTTRAEETVTDAEPRTSKPAREHPVVEVRFRFIARPVPGVQANRRIQLLIVQQREQRHPQGGVRCVHPGRRRGVAAVEMVPDPNPGLDVGRVHAIDHQLGPAVIHVVKRRRDGQPGRGEPRLDVVPGGGAAFPEAEQPRVGRLDRDRRRTLHELPVGVPGQAATDPDAAVRFLGDPGVVGRRQEKIGTATPFCSMTAATAGELRVSRVDGHLELRL